MTHTAAIVIPLYKPQLSPLEKISVDQCFKVLSKHKIIAIKPHHLSLNLYPYAFDEVISFDDYFFQDIQGYNKLMLSNEFYEKFLNYTYILMYQPDSFVFDDALDFWCEKGYDYIGAPWLRYTGYPDRFKQYKNTLLNFIHIKYNLKQANSDLPSILQFENRVGNGGFSLRNTKKFNEICIQEKSMIESYNKKNEHYFNEDIFWGIEVNRKKKRLRIPGYKEAAYFSIENMVDHAFKITKGELPFGCHAWDKQVDFWAPLFARVDVKI